MQTANTIIAMLLGMSVISCSSGSGSGQHEATPAPAHQLSTVTSTEASSGQSAASSQPLQSNLTPPVEPALPSGSGIAYAVSKLPLFGSSGLALASDVVQNQIGDCTLSAALIAVANKNSQFLADGIRYIGTDTNHHDVYDISLFSTRNGAVSLQPLTVRISSLVPVYTASGQQVDSASTTLWYSLYSKAVAALGDTYPFDKVAGGDPNPGYGNIDGIPLFDVIQTIGGVDQLQDYLPDSAKSPDKNLPAATFNALLSQLKPGQSIAMASSIPVIDGMLEAVAKARQLAFDGQTLTLPSGNLVRPSPVANGVANTFDLVNPAGKVILTIVGGHGHAIDGIDPNDPASVLVYNPWANNNVPGEGHFSMKMADFSVMMNEVVAGPIGSRK